MDFLRRVVAACPRQEIAIRQGRGKNKWFKDEMVTLDELLKGEKEGCSWCDMEYGARGFGHSRRQRIG